MLSAVLRVRGPACFWLLEPGVGGGAGAGPGGAWRGVVRLVQGQAEPGAGGGGCECRRARPVGLPAVAASRACTCGSLLLEARHPPPPPPVFAALRASAACHPQGRNEAEQSPARLLLLLQPRRGLDKQSRARYREAPAAAGCEASLSSLSLLEVAMSRFYPVWKCECEGVGVKFFEPWQEWVRQTEAFKSLSLHLDNLMFFYDSVTVSAISDCVLCVFDMCDGSLVAFADGGLVAAVREPRY